ncbi:VanZ family protein [uncultured Chryseobacterium sp.]|uniref:VanZ family protein n=1 Tax=uncultured Chryseobacterium sp. TaxID=259322 RepID=UPI002630D35C|nr:VanZ family protein [uncultured Chryseobacterium sp.]
MQQIWWKYTKTVSAMLYFALIIYITFLARRRLGDTDYRANANLILFDKFVSAQDYFKMPAKARQGYIQDVLGNVLMFMPFIPALEWVLRKNIKTVYAVLLIFAGSALIEILQYVLNRGVFDVDDILLNVLGGLTGLLLVRIFCNHKKLMNQS